MDEYIVILAILTIAIQYFFWFLVKNRRTLFPRYITSYIRNLYHWLFASSVLIFTFTFGKSILGVPLPDLDIIVEKTTLVYIVIYITILLAFFPIKILGELIYKMERLR